MTEKKYPVGGFSPGNYMGTCKTCNAKFIGDKRAYQCEPCGTELDAKEKPLKEAAKEYSKFEEEFFEQCAERDFTAGAIWQESKMNEKINELSRLVAKYRSDVWSGEHKSINDLEKETASLRKELEEAKETIIGFHTDRIRIISESCSIANALKEERAKSAKLVEALRAIKNGDGETWYQQRDIARLILADYEGKEGGSNG